MKFLLILRDPSGRDHVHPIRYDFHIQAELEGEKLCARQPGWTYSVKPVKA